MDEQTKQTIDNVVEYIMNVCTCQQRFISLDNMYDGAKNRFSISKEDFADCYNDIKTLITECVKANNPNFKGFKI